MTLVVGAMMIRIARMMSIQTQVGQPQHTTWHQGQQQSLHPPHCPQHLSLLPTHKVIKINLSGDQLFLYKNIRIANDR